MLRTSRFFPEGDDDADVRGAYADANVKANEYLYRRVDVADVVDAHLLAMERAARIGFAKYIISATTPFTPADLAELRDDAPAVVRRLFPDYEAEYARRGWRMFPSIGRVYVNARARDELGWSPRYDFRSVLDALKAGEDPSQPARAGHRRQGVPRQADRRLHRLTGRARSRASGRAGRRRRVPAPPGRAGACRP